MVLNERTLHLRQTRAVYLPYISLSLTRIEGVFMRESLHILGGLLLRVLMLSEGD